MGVHSTLVVDRRAALKAWRILTEDHYPSDDFLEKVLAIVLDERGHNISVVASRTEPRDDLDNDYVVELCRDIVGND